jgi:prepilin-type N-terminal cleavage/methylation domain-containing protein
MAVGERSTAFTLLELLIVVMIMAIFGAVVVPMVMSNQDTQCAAAARALVADLELAQSTALARQANVAVVFSTTRQAYKVALADGQTLTNYDSLVALDHPERPGRPYEIAPRTDLGLPNLIINSANFGGASYVVFNAFGSPTASGTVALRARDATLTISLEAITGAVSVN